MTLQDGMDERWPRAFGEWSSGPSHGLRRRRYRFHPCHVWGFPTPGDISQAPAQHPSEYTLSLGHMGDLTLSSFAYLRAAADIYAGIAAWSRVFGHCS